MTAAIGTIISGTMRDADLIPAFLATLDALESGAAQRLLDQFGAYPFPPHAFHRWDADSWERWAEACPEPASYLTHELFDVLDEYAPEDAYFGAAEGNGSEYGFFPALDPGGAL